MRLLDEARQPYEEVMELADLADLADGLYTDTAAPAGYSWDNPVGLVVRESRHSRTGFHRSPFSSRATATSPGTPEPVVPAAP